MSDPGKRMADDGDWPALVPELACADLARSCAFYCDLLGFSVRYERPESGFCYLERGRVHLMLEQAGGHWSTAALEPPYGRGINLQIEVQDARDLAVRARQAGIALFRPLQTAWYRDGAREHGQDEFLVQDPDGYLLRFITPLGTRPLAVMDPHGPDLGSTPGRPSAPASSRR